MSYSNTSEGTLLLWGLMLHSASDVCMLHQLQNRVAEDYIFSGFVLKNHISCNYVDFLGNEQQESQNPFTEAYCSIKSKLPVT